MSIRAQEIDESGLGRAQASGRFADEAVAAARALAQSDPAFARWVDPFARAIQRKRLRLPSLSPTVHRILKLIESADAHLDEIAAAVNSDPALATRIMGVANSSFFRGASEVTSVRDALMRMGIREARTIVIVVALRSTVLRSPGLGDLAHGIWKHALLSASACQEVTSELPRWETAGFLAGLVHELGQLAVLAFASELPAWQEDGAAPSPAAVATLADATLVSLGAMILESWSFPPAFCEAVFGQRAPASVAGEAAELAAVIDLGHRIAHGIEHGWPRDPADLDPDLLAAGARFGLDGDRLTDIASEAEANFEALNKLS
ncbi:MAG: HDOD domain-containing protein [Myxococcota bacterium]